MEVPIQEKFSLVTRKVYVLPRIPEVGIRIPITTAILSLSFLSWILIRMKS